MILARIGAGLFGLWGVIHVLGGFVLLIAALEGTAAFHQALSGQTSAGAPQGDAATSMVFAFHAFNIAWLGALSIVVAMLLNWRNRASGFWFNLAIVGLADIGLLLFMVVPGVIPLQQAWIGPLLLVFAAAVSGYALRTQPGN